MVGGDSNYSVFMKQGAQRFAAVRNVAEQRGSKFKVQGFKVSERGTRSKRSSRSTASLRSKRYLIDSVPYVPNDWNQNQNRRTAASRRSYDSRKRLATKTISQGDLERSQSR
jgi:hypothetical protein